MLASKQLTIIHVSLAGGTARTSEPAFDAPRAQPRDRRKLIFAIVSNGLFMASADQTNVMASQTLACRSRLRNRIIGRFVGGQRRRLRYDQAAGQAS